MDGFTLDKISSVCYHVYHNETPIGYIKWKEGFYFYLPKFKIRSKLFPHKLDCFHGMKTEYLAKNILESKS